MKILLLGKNGQVGWELQRALAPLGELIALDRYSAEYCGDLSNLDGLRRTLRAVAPDVIVNAAAYTAVDNAESDRATAQLINADATRVMAEEAASSGIWLVHYSTDYVFDGTGDIPWTETSQVSPVNFYGASKLAGEQVIVASGCKHLIFRTSWVYGVRGNNFAKTMLRLAKDRDTLNVIADQFGAPTGAELLADVASHAIIKVRMDEGLSGIYHLAASGEVSWHGYAQFVIDFAKAQGESLAVTSVLPIPSSSYPTPAMRPRNSRMDTRKLCDKFGLTLPHWSNGVTRMLQEINLPIA
jgi:dTDP-4-dehydrorhamnose reductase